MTKCLDGADPCILTETDLKKTRMGLDGMGCSLNTVSKWSQTSVVVMVVVINRNCYCLLSQSGAVVMVVVVNRNSY